MDALQLSLDGLGMAPGVGIAFDLVNAGISVFRGNFVDAGLSLGCAIPGLGQGIGAGKIAVHATMFGAGIGKIGNGLSTGSKFFRNKSFRQIDELFLKKGFISKGPDPLNGKGMYVNPRNGTKYYFDKGGVYRKGVEGPHVDVWLNGKGYKYRFFLE